jgi:hypothetical protein
VDSHCIPLCETFNPIFEKAPVSAKLRKNPLKYAVCGFEGNPRAFVLFNKKETIEQGQECRRIIPANGVFGSDKVFASNKAERIC